MGTRASIAQEFVEASERADTKGYDLNHDRAHGGANHLLFEVMKPYLDRMWVNGPDRDSLVKVGGLLVDAVAATEADDED